MVFLEKKTRNFYPFSVSSNNVVLRFFAKLKFHPFWTVAFMSADNITYKSSERSLSADVHCATAVLIPKAKQLITITSPL